MELIVKIELDEELLEEDYTRLRVKSITCNGKEVERQVMDNARDKNYFWPFFDTTEDMEGKNVGPLLLSVVEDRI